MSPYPTSRPAVESAPVSPVAGASRPLARRPATALEEAARPAATSAPRYAAPPPGPRPVVDASASSGGPRTGAPMRRRSGMDPGLVQPGPVARAVGVPTDERARSAPGSVRSTVGGWGRPPAAVWTPSRGLNKNPGLPSRNRGVSESTGSSTGCFGDLRSLLRVPPAHSFGRPRGHQPGGHRAARPATTQPRVLHRGQVGRRSSLRRLPAALRRGRGPAASGAGDWASGPAPFHEGTP